MKKINLTSFSKPIAYIIASIIIISMVDTKLMAYPSLSRSLFAGTLIMFAVLFSIFQMGKGKIEISRLQSYIILWLTYIFFYCHIIPSDNYRVLYLCGTIIYSFMIAFAKRANLISERYIENIFLTTAIFQFIILLYQMIDTGFSLEIYSLTGSYENPTTVALLLTGCCPLILHRLCYGNHYRAYLIFFISVVIMILLLKCRTAYIGLAIIIIIYLKPFALKKGIWNKCMRRSIVILSSILMVASIPLLYQMKRTSADSRLFIWQRTLDMIEDNPVGYGYGLFERNYNLKQAEYFSNAKFTEKEKMDADFVAICYNDILEQSVEGGCIGGLLFFGFFIVTGLTAIRQADRKIFSIVLSFLIMSLFNFVYTSDAAWLLMMSFAGLAAGKDNKIIFSYKRQSTINSFKLVCLLVAIIIIFTDTSLARSQITLNSLIHLIKTGQPVKEESFEKIKKDIGTSELFYTALAQNHLLEGNPLQSEVALNMAAQYTSKPNVYYLKCETYIQQKKIKKALKCLNLVAYMQPHRIKPIYQAMLICKDNKLNTEGLRYAKKIITMPIKIPNRLADEYKKEAIEYLYNSKKKRHANKKFTTYYPHILAAGKSYI